MHRLVILCLLIGLSTKLNAGELVHQFIDPGFGGNPNNSNYVLGLASAQNQTKNENAASSSPSLLSGATQQSFSQLLQQELQQQLAQQIINSLTGQTSTPLKDGAYALGSDTVTIKTAGDGSKTVTITDPTGTTQFNIP